MPSGLVCEDKMLICFSLFHKTVIILKTMFWTVAAQNHVLDVPLP